MFDDVPQDVIVMEHDTDDIKITVFDDTNHKTVEYIYSRFVKFVVPIIIII